MGYKRHAAMPIPVRQDALMPKARAWAQVSAFARSGGQSCREHLVDPSPVQINDLEPPAESRHGLARGGYVL